MEILQARILEWVGFPFSRGSSRPRDQICVSCTAGRFFTTESPGKPEVKVAQPCPTLCDPMDCTPPGFSAHGDSPGKNTGVGCHALLQGIFPTQGSNPGLLHRRWILYYLSHQESLSLLQGIFPTQESSLSLLHCRWILYQLTYQGSLGVSLSIEALKPGIDFSILAIKVLDGIFFP